MSTFRHDIPSPMVRQRESLLYDTEDRRCVDDWRSIIIECYLATWQRQIDHC